MILFEAKGTRVAPVRPQSDANFPSTAFLSPIITIIYHNIDYNKCIAINLQYDYVHWLAALFSTADLIRLNKLTHLKSGWLVTNRELIRPFDLMSRYVSRPDTKTLKVQLAD